MKYQKEIYPSHIIYLEDDPYNRKKMIEKFGVPTLSSSDYTYIELDIDKKTWRSCYTFEWLYRNPPPITEINEVL